jgi:cytochrome c-type biogenesis protein CcmH/NrfG
MRSWVRLAVLLVSAAAWSAEAAPPKPDANRCLTHATIDACSDALRRSPSDPTLLVALGDAELQTKRPADALRHYRRAAELAPNLPGLVAKITATEARLHPPHNAVAGRVAKPAPSAARDKAYSNVDPVAESH